MTKRLLLFFSVYVLSCAPAQPPAPLNTCTAALVGKDIVVTALHCVSNLALVAGKIARPSVRVGDLLVIDVRVMCPGVRLGRITQITGNLAALDTQACPGNSGSPVFMLTGHFVGVVVGRTGTHSAAVVELF